MVAGAKRSRSSWLEASVCDKASLVSRFKSKSGKYIALIPDTSDTGFSVVVTAWGVAAFCAGWPCSRLKERPTRFEYSSNGDLVDIPHGNQPDGPELLALSEDAQEFGEKCKAKLRKPAPGATSAPSPA